jgi:dTDP-D-glucose 4,6-dehydratase
VAGTYCARALKGEEEHGVPMLFFFSTCEHTIRTVPALQHDEMRIEDVNTKGEDHAGDETRYACSARPWVREIQPQPERRYERSIDLSVEEIISAHRRKKRGDA